MIFPASQLLQTLLPAVLYLPVMHRVHAVGGVLGAWPARHDAQVIEPVELAYFPSVHVVQVVAETALYVPVAHIVQEALPEAAYLPASQAVQEDAAAAL